MKSKIVITCILPLAFLLPLACNASDFIEPETVQEWEKFCKSPDYFEVVKSIKDKQQQENAAKTCLRSPWVEHKKSEERSW